MTATAEPVRIACSICGDDADGVHFGADSCAACAAFFRRSVKLGLHYSCKREGACMSDKSVRCVCRACRFEKCVENGMDELLVQPSRESIGTKSARKHQTTKSDVPERVEPPSALTSPINATQEPELINKMRAAYKQLLHNRNVTYCSNSLKTMLIDDVPPEKPELRPADMAHSAHLVHVEVSFAMEYVKSMDHFLLLPPDQKFEFFKAFLCIWGGIETSFYSVKMGGFEKKWMVMPDNTYIDLNNLPGYFNSDIIKLDKETAVKLFSSTGDIVVTQIMQPMVQNKMDEAEFVTLTAISCWTCDPALSNSSDETKALGKGARDQLCDELFIYYANIGVPDPDIRLGNLLLMVPALHAYARVNLENYRLAKFFDMINSDKLLEDLFG